MIILHEVILESRNLFKYLPIEAFKEQAPIVTEHLWLEQEYIRDRQTGYFDHKSFSFSTRSRYCP